MELRIFTEPQQGATYDDLLTVALYAERLGFGAFFRSDHYTKMGNVTGLPGPTDAWTTLAGLARDTSTIRLGTLVTAGTFRLPGPLAITVATVDAMSNGRIELGLGAGWYELEHAQYGIAFPPVGERFDRLEEQFAIITGLWDTPSDKTFSFEGSHYSLTDSPALPKPVQSPHPPLIVGGTGPSRTPALAARYAAEYNVAFRPVDETAAAYARVRAACETAGRDPDDLIYSAAQVLCVGENDDEVARRAAAIGREPDELRANGIAGSADEALAKIAQFTEIGATRLYLQVLDLTDYDHLELVAAEVMPRL
jgi:F420-dependent oxidoreductase-like protein